MKYTVFISHSSDDIDVVRQYASELFRYGITPIIAQDHRPDKSPIHLPQKIKELILQSDCLIAFLTKKGVKTNWVHSEIAFALDKITIIPLVEKGVKSTQLTFLEGAEYIAYDSNNSIASFSHLSSWLDNFQKQKLIKLNVQKVKQQNIKIMPINYNQTLTINYPDDSTRIVAIAGITALTILGLYAIYKILK